VSNQDTGPFITELAPIDRLDAGTLSRLLPVSAPVRGNVLAVAALHERMLDLVGLVLEYSPSQRQRGEKLHRAACQALGLGSYADTGRFPDIVCQRRPRPVEDRARRRRQGLEAGGWSVVVRWLCSPA